MTDDWLKVDGLDELKRALDALSPRLKRKVIRSAITGAARIVAREASKNAPVLKGEHPHRLPGTIRKSIKAKASRVYNGSGDEVGAYVAVSKRRGLGGKAGARNPFDPFYWKFLEFGTKKMAAREFMRPALEAKTPEVIEYFSRRLAAAIEKENLKK